MVASLLPRLINAVLFRPKAILRILDAALISAQRSHAAILGLSVNSIKYSARVRLDFHRIALLQLGSSVSQLCAPHSGQILTIQGTVTRVSAVRSYEVEQLFECDFCKHRFSVPVSQGQKHNFAAPRTCPRSLTSASTAAKRAVAACAGTSFSAVQTKLPILNDFQEIHVQDSSWAFAERTKTCLPLDLTLLGADGWFKQRQYQRTSNIEAPKRSIAVILVDDLVDKCRPGDDICITVTVLSRWHKARCGQRAEVEMICSAISVSYLPNGMFYEHQRAGKEDVDDFASFWRYGAHHTTASRLEEPAAAKMQQTKCAGRDLLLDSFCPQLFQLYPAKLAFLLSLIGGVSYIEYETGNHNRNECHILMIGDPGTGKSQLLKYVAKLAPKSVNATGTGLTSAGLTATMRKGKDSNSWILDAGVLVLADSGVCCIDQFEKISGAQLAAFQEAMEQQTLSITMDTMVARLQTRCSLFASANPVAGRIDTALSLSANTGLQSPILSRFDCILVFKDDMSSRHDRAISSHLTSHNQRNYVDNINHEPSAINRVDNERKSSLMNRQRFSCQAMNRGKGYLSFEAKGTHAGMLSQTQHKLWSFQHVRRYVLLVRYAVDPVLSSEAEMLIRGFYQVCRREGVGLSARPTIRLLVSLIRLSQAHAKLLWNQQVRGGDVVVAVDILKASNDFTLPAHLGSTCSTSMPDASAMLQSEIQLIGDIERVLGPSW